MTTTVEMVPIVGADGYFVGVDGHVYSTKAGEARQLYTCPDRDGYLMVQLSSAGVKSTRHVHQLACVAFCGARPSVRHEVRHLDGVRANNTRRNLAWGTRKENADDRARHGRTVRGEASGSPLTLSQAREIKRRAPHENGAELAREFAISVKTVWAIKTGLRWAHA